MNKFVEVMCFIGGANLDILKKCPAEKNGFIATGIGILNVVILSIVAMWLIFSSAIKDNIILTLITSTFYGFIVFIGYWGILSVIRRTVKYNVFIKVFSFLVTIIFAFIATMSAKNLVPVLNIQNVSTVKQKYY
jgi:hypothetical protein